MCVWGGGGGLERNAHMTFLVDKIDSDASLRKMPPNYYTLWRPRKAYCFGPPKEKCCIKTGESQLRV